MKKVKDCIISFTTIGFSVGFFVSWFIFKYLGD